jgi:hypothetical protein
VLVEEGGDGPEAGVLGALGHRQILLELGFTLVAA